MRFISKTKLIIFSILSANLIIFPSLAFADEVTLKAAEQNEIVQSINIKQAELDDLSNQYTAAILKQEEIQNNIKVAEEKIKDLNIKLENKKEQLEKQCNTMYRQGDITILDVLLDSSDFTSFITNVDFCQRYINQTDNLILETQNLKTQIEKEKNIQEQEQQELLITIQEIEDSKALADAAIAELQFQYEQLDEEIAALILQQQLSENVYIQENATEILNSGNASSQIYQAIAQIQAEDAVNGVSSDYNDIVSRAYSMLGTSYAWGGTTSAGFDCSGFVSYCLTGEEGTRLGTTETFAGWNQVSDPQPGDVCVIHNGSSQHTGIYVGNGNMVHAATYGVGVVEGPVQDGMIYVRPN